MAFRKIYKEKMKLSVDGSLLKLSNLVLTEGQKRAYLTADVSAAGTTLTVDNYSGIADNDYLLLGEWGEPTAEIVQVNDASVDATITVGALVHDHYTDTPVTVVPCDKVEFYRETTLIAAPNTTNPTNAVGSDVAIMAYRKETIASDATNTTGYAYARFQNTEDTKYSEFTHGVAYEGNAHNSLEEMSRRACTSVGIKVGDEFAEEENIMEDANEAQDSIAEKNNWTFELIANDSSIATTENGHKYDLSDLTYSLKYTDSVQGIFNAKFGTDPMKYIDMHQMEDLYDNVASTTMSAAVAVSDVILECSDVADFSNSGTVYIGANSYTYSNRDTTNNYLAMTYAYSTGSTALSTAAAKTDTTIVVADASDFTVGDFIEVTDTTNTQVFEISVISTNTITLNGATIAHAFAATTTTVKEITSTQFDAVIATSTEVWQGLSPGIPEKYSIFDGYIYLDRPVETDKVGTKIKLKYLRALSRFDDFSDTTLIPFYRAISKYIEYKIELRRGNKEAAMLYKTEFDKTVDINENTYKLPIMESLEYYNFGFDESDNDDE